MDKGLKKKKGKEENRSRESKAKKTGMVKQEDEDSAKASLHIQKHTEFEGTMSPP